MNASFSTPAVLEDPMAQLAVVLLAPFAQMRPTGRDGDRRISAYLSLGASFLNGTPMGRKRRGRRLCRAPRYAELRLTAHGLGFDAQS
jgi:hypothetical protein